MFANILSIFAILAIAFPVTGSVSAQESSPFLVAFPEWWSVEGYGWPADALVRLSIDDPTTAESPDFQQDEPVVPTPWDPNGFYVKFNFWPVYELKSGDIVNLDDGTMASTHIVRSLSVTSVDVAANTVAGTADANAMVQVNPYEAWDQILTVTAGNDGIWLADFTGVFDFAGVTGGRSQIFDGFGNRTAVDWSVPPPPPLPWLVAFPENDAVQGWEWPDGSTVTLTIDNAPGLEWSGIAEVTTWGDPRTYFHIEFGADYNLQVGDMVTLTDGVTSRTHEVQSLAVKQVEISDDTIYGRADAGAVVHAWVHEHGESEMVTTAEDNGTWMAEFWRIGFDLVEGMCGRSEIRDDVGNATAVDWCYPVPHFTAFPEQDYIEGFDWHPNAYVYLSIERETSEELVTFYTQARTEPTPWDPNSWWVRFDLAGQLDLQAGDTVHLDDDSVERTMTVRNLAITNVDTVANVVGGTADPGAVVQVWPHETGEQLQAGANASGAWQVDFTGMFDLVPGTCGRSQIVDGFDNATAVDWCAPKPWLIAFPENDAVEGWEWPMGKTVTLTINNAPEGFYREGTAEVTTWGDPRTYIRFDFAGEDGYDLQIGDQVTLTGEDGTTRTHTVQNLAITKADPEDDVIKGTANVGAEVYAWPHATGQQQLATANPRGKWEVDFTGIYDLMPREGGRAEIRDEMGNSTAVDWYIPQPRFTIFPDAQWFDGLDWPDGATVTITVKDKPECEFTRESWGGFFNGGFPEGCVVTAGDRVTFTDGTTTRKHTVQNLAIIMVDKDVNTVAGIADTGAVVHTWVWGSDGSTLDGSNLEVTAVNSAWLADFGALGIDLEIGMGIQAEIRDENGNATSVDLPVPDPRIVASITEDWFYIVDFIPASTLDLSIYESQGGSTVWQGTRTADVNGFAWIDAESWDLIPGNYLVVSDGNTTKELVIEGFTFDVFDLANGRLIGTALEANGSREVWTGIGWQDQDTWTMNVTTDGGAWIADFGTPVPADYWWVAAQIFDDDGDASELRPDRVVDLWVAAYTYDYGTWPAGDHSYHFDATWTGGSEITDEIYFNVSDEAELYEGLALLRPGAVRAGVDCPAVDAIHPDQLTRFLAGYVTDQVMTYEEAVTFFENLTAEAVWDGSMSAELAPHEIIPFRWDDWFQYVCTFTSP
jgi:hypothetical protein